jgi:hypothetical protein
MKTREKSTEITDNVAPSPFSARTPVVTRPQCLRGKFSPGKGRAFLALSTSLKNMTACAHAYWKVENGNNNVLKNHGYNRAHNGKTKFPTVMGRKTQVKYLARSIFWIFASRYPASYQR